MSKTQAELFSHVWNESVFDSRTYKPKPLSEDALLSIARLALAGWTFCGAGEDFIELERDGLVMTIDSETGETSIDTSHFFYPA